MGARFGRYETLHPIASGGMATVHLARAIGAGGFERLVAIKVMHPGLGEDPEFAAMFLDEARVAARIRHPNVVGTVDVQEGPEGLFLVMEYVEGPSLFAISRTLAKKQQRMPLGIALRIVIDALLGLHAAHEQTGPEGEPLNIVHRDVSPQNILVGVDGQAKITDFGVARAESRLSSTRRGEVKGKLAYMSPQQVRNEGIDRRADVYAAGVVLWELLAGERLFRGDNDGALLLSVMTGAQRSPRQADERIPAPLDRECMRALRIPEDQRHPSALAFAEALELAAEEAGVALATSRALAAFVKELGAHKPIDVPALEGAPRASRVSLTSGTGTGSVPKPPAHEEPAPPPSSAPARPEAEANSQVASVLTAPSAAAPAGSRGRFVIAAVAVAVLLGGGALAFRLLGGEPAQPAAAPPAASSAPAPASAAPSVPAPATAAPSTSATATASAEATAATAATAHPKGAAPGRAPAAKGPKSGGATDWRPQGL